MSDVRVNRDGTTTIIGLSIGAGRPRRTNLRCCGPLFARMPTPEAMRARVDRHPLRTMAVRVSVRMGRRALLLASMIAQGAGTTPSRKCFAYVR